MCGEAAHVHFVYDGARRGPVEWPVTFPIVCAGVDHHAFHSSRGVVALHSGGVTAVIFGDHNGSCIRVEQDLGGIETMAARGIEWSTNPKPVDLAWGHVPNPYVPVVIGTVRHGIDRDYAGRTRVAF